MPNLRIVSDNALERASSLTASTTAGALAASNLVSWKKSSLWRATGTSARITALFATPEPIQFAGFPFCNCSPTAMMRVRASSEAAATNLARYSGQFDNAAWIKYQSTITANVAGVYAPDGSQAADKLVETAVTGTHIVNQSVAGFLLGQNVTFSVWLKSGERTFAALGFDSSSTAAPTVTTVYINLSTGALSTTSSNGWTFSVTSHVSGFWRLKAVRTATVAGILNPLIHTATSMTTASYLGVAGSGIYVWGAQLEVGDAASSYYPTTTVAATRPAGYIDTWQSYDYDSGLVPACPWPAAKLRGYTAAQAASAYAYGGGTYARHWMPAEIQARGLAVDIADPDNVQGYIEAACMVVGSYWSPKYNAAAAPLTPLDSSENIGTGGGDTCGEAGFISKEIPVDLGSLTPTDRATVMNMARSSSVYPVLISIFPEDSDLAKERDHMAYATRSKSSEIGMRHAFAYQTKITFKEV